MADGNSPLNMGAPWDAISGLGAPQQPGFGQELARAFQPQPTFQPQRNPGEEELQRALSGMREFQARLVTTQAASNVPKPADEMTVKTDPKTGQKTAIVKTSLENFQATTDSAMKYHEMLGGYAKQLDAIQGRLAAQEQNIRSQSPWVQLATALSANLASQPDMPGWVRGLGQTAAQLNPNPDQIEMKRAALLNEQASLAEKGAALDIGQLKALMTGEYNAAAEAEKAKTEAGRKVKNFMQDARLSAKSGEPMPRAAFEAKADLFEIPQEQRQALYEGHVAQAGATVAQEQRKEGYKKDLTTLANDLATQKGVTLSQVGAAQKASLMREAFALNHGADALAFEKAKREVSMATALQLAQAKSTGVISASDSDKLQGGLSTNTYLGSLGNMLSKPEWSDVAEPLFVVDRGKNGSVEGVRINPEATLPKAWQSLSRAESDNMLKHEIPRLLSLLFKQGVGAQMFRSKEGAKILMDLGISNNMRLDQMQSILKTIRETNNLSNFQPVAVTKHGVDWSDPKMAAMLALDDPENAEFWSGKDRFGGRIPVTNPKAKAGTPTLSKADFDEWLKKQQGAK